MADTTITEALAELKTITKRVQKKREFISANIGRLEKNKDPLEKDGGSVAAIQREAQAVQDLQARSIRIRRAIARANDETQIQVDGVSRSIADWLIWRREIAPEVKNFYQHIQRGIANVRADARNKNARVVSDPQDAKDPMDVIIHVSEAKLAQESEQLETILGTLDGQLSLKNATVVVNVD